jgi:hypothetical protein
MGRGRGTHHARQSLTAVGRSRACRLRCLIREERVRSLLVAAHAHPTYRFFGVTDVDKHDIRRLGVAW